MVARRLIITALFLIFNSTIGLSQSDGDTIRIELLKRDVAQSPRQVFEKSSMIIPSAFLLTPDVEATAKLGSNSMSGSIAFELPISGKASLSLLVREVSVLASGFKVTTSSNKKLVLPSLKFYSGRVSSDDSSRVSLSISAEGIEGIVYGKGYSYTVGKLRGTNSQNLHMVYQTHELPEKGSIDCMSVEAVVTNAVKSGVPASTARIAEEECRSVGIYIEADYALYQDWGSSIPYITSQITAIFNNVATLYANEGVPIKLSELKIWDTQDPYISANNRNEILGQFKNYWNSRGNTFNGDIAHLLSTRINGGGAAYFGVGRKPNVYSIDDMASVFFKSASRELAFGISTGFSDSPVPPLPEYSYKTYLMAHELGHNFGLPHTHSCLWHGGPIDNCNSVEGTCPPGPTPTNLGTIMSYCADLANGFGPQPGARLKYELLTAQNLINSGVNPPSVLLSPSTVAKGQNIEISVFGCPDDVVWDDAIVTGPFSSLIAKAPILYTAACTGSGCMSAPIEVFINPICVHPPACSVSRSTELSNVHGISVFSFGSINTDVYYAGPAYIGTSYEDFTCNQHAILKAGESYPFVISGAYENDVYARIYIDYNGDGIFSDTDELVYNGTTYTAQHTGSITIPNSALYNTPLRLRVLVNPLPLTSACTLPSNGQYPSGKANDYAVTITAPTCPPGVRETVQSGDWNDPLVWSCGTLPTASDFVKINSGHFISLWPDATGEASGLELIGTLQYGNKSKLRFNQP